MKKLSSLTVAIIIFFFLGILSGIIQSNFYGYIDEAGILHDSLFLPLSVIFILIGIILLLISLVRFIIRKIKK